MSIGPVEVGEVFRRYREAFFEEFGDVISFEQRWVLDSISACRTPVLGGHLYECDTCNHQLVLHNSCSNRHCPQCQAEAAAEWFEDRQAELLPVGYYHVVFTLPSSLAPLALQNKRVVYGLLFRAASQTLLEIAADPRHFGAKIGFLALLHTWGQTLLHHPHIHCVVPGGGLSPARSRWVSSRSNFFLPVHVLSRLFRGKLLAYLEQAFQDKKLTFDGSLAHLANEKVFHSLINTIRKKEWVVYSKAPFGSPSQTLKYLARYTHRVAISNKRLISIDDGKVTFGWKDYASGNRRRRITIEATEFIRRFLLHVLPKGFVKIRSYGFMANRGRKENLDLCRQLLGARPSPNEDQPAEPDLSEKDEPVSDSDRSPSLREHLCPICKVGRMIPVREIAPARTLSAAALSSTKTNTA